MTHSNSVLVTGGAGFLGSHLCDKLLADGHDVVCVDNFFTGSRRNVEHMLDNKRFELIRHDVTFPPYIEVARIFNLACPASPVHYQFDPVQTTKTSVHGAINVLGLAKRVRARILQASTSEVYGDPDTPARLYCGQWCQGSSFELPSGGAAAIVVERQQRKVVRNHEHTLHATAEGSRACADRGERATRWSASASRHMRSNARAATR
jgi:nucleoside-diphosphate-sugar epimerase